jgi:hypothetical protein
MKPTLTMSAGTIPASKAAARSGKLPIDIRESPLIVTCNQVDLGWDVVVESP